MNSPCGVISGKRPASEGFTLLEIMVAMVIFAVIITTVFGSFRLVFSSADAVTGDVAFYESARICLDRITMDLDSLVVTDYPRYSKPEFSDPEDIYRLVGDTSDVAGSTFGRLRFASLAHLPLNQDPRQGVCRIVYYVDEGFGDYLVLRRADHLYPFPEFEKSEDDPILCERILALEFEFLGEEEEMEDHWNSESDDFGYATPRLVEVRMTIGDEQRSRSFSTRINLHVYRETDED